MRTSRRRRRRRAGPSHGDTAAGFVLLFAAFLLGMLAMYLLQQFT